MVGALTQEGLEANTKTYNLLICADKPRTAHLHLEKERGVAGGEGGGDPLARTLEVLQMMDR